MNGVAALLPTSMSAWLLWLLWLIPLKAVLEFLICETEEEPRQAW